jgi:outer membrane protein assembly factor BamB
MIRFVIRMLPAVLLVGTSVSLTAASEWSGFRGQGDGVARGASPPLQWATRGSRRGGWTVRLPGYGQSSPVVWGSRVFITAVSGDEKETLHVVCCDLSDGRRLWELQFSATQRVPDSDTVSRGAPTPVASAEAVFVMFESGDLIALSHDGEELWKRSIVKDYGEFQGPHGYASSPVLAGGFVILQVCHRGPSYVLAVDQQTGETRWKTEHPSQTAWSTPAVIDRADEKLVIVSSVGSVRAYRVADGAEQWFVSGLSGNSTASPAIDGDVVVIGCGQRDAGDAGASLAIRLGGTGDVTETHVLWKSTKVTTGYSTPAATGGLGFFVNKSGVASCVDMPSGKVNWTERLPGECWASPIVTDGHVVFFSKSGDVVAYKAGPTPERVAESSISTTDVVYGVAAVDGAWLVRTGRGLIKIATPTGAGAESSSAAAGR